MPAPGDDLDHIIDTLDRSATSALVDELGDPGTDDDRVAAVQRALFLLADPRTAEPLRRMGEDTAIDATVRERALAALAGGDLAPSRDRLRAWWASNDELLRSYALLLADRSETDLLAPVVRDAAHPLHREAIGALGFPFEEPEWQAAKIEALGHADAGVRTVAAEKLRLHAPVAAEASLHDLARHDEDDVAVAAIATLASFHDSRATMTLLAELAQPDDNDGRSARSAAAGDAFAEARTRLFDNVRLHLSDETREHQERVWQWLRPILGLLQVTEADLADEPESAPDRRTAPPPSRDLLAIYDDADGPWRSKLADLYSYDWSAVPAAERSTLGNHLRTHPDPQVRDAAGWALAEWDEVESLLMLAAADPVASVRSNAVFQLERVSPSAEVADFTWKLIESRAVAWSDGQQALDTHVAHAGAGKRRDALMHLARHDQREMVRFAAIGALPDEDVLDFADLLGEPPLVTWAVHGLILATYADLGQMPPHLSDLRLVDNLTLANDLAAFD